jgi:hypothetical protein
VLAKCYVGTERKRALLRYNGDDPNPTCGVLWSLIDTGNERHACAPVAVGWVGCRPGMAGRIEQIQAPGRSETFLIAPYRTYVLPVSVSVSVSASASVCVRGGGYGPMVHAVRAGIATEVESRL